MNRSNSTGKLIIIVLAIVCVALIAVFVCKSCGVFGGNEEQDFGDIANYGQSGETITTDNGGEYLSTDDSTLEMDEIPSDVSETPSSTDVQPAE